MNVLKSLLDLFFPPQCFSCNKRIDKELVLCEKCADELSYIKENSCIFCNRETKEGLICEECKQEYPFDEVVSAYTFNLPLQRMIHHFKYNEFKRIGTFLGNSLADRISKYPFYSSIDYILPVPLHKTKKRFRGFNQSEIIARALSVKLNIPILKNVVKRKKFTQTQTKLKKHEREKNVANAFQVKKFGTIKNKSLLLVDDVLTTGSTMKSIALLLKENLAKHIYVCTLARA